MHHSAARWLFACTIFASAFSLFLVQPLIAKQILPWFGGTAAVWAICMVFFQITLLAGYAYSDALASRLAPRRQIALHATLLALSLLFLPIIANVGWKPTGAEDPSLLIIGLLAATIGLPYFLLSTTGPLVQAWVAQVGLGHQVYRLFSLSNLASLAALLSYPFLIEAHATLRQQAYGWSALFAAFVLLCIAAGIYFARHVHGLPAATQHPIHLLQDERTPSWPDYLLWLAPAALASWLLVAITNHITQNVAAIPFLWIVPLTLYLLTFVLCFDGDRWYRRGLFVPLGGALLLLCAYGLQDSDIGLAVKVAIPLYTACLFVLCMLLHGELARLRPPTRYLTRYYLMLSVGGALGGTLVGLVAPRVFPAYYELGLGFALVGVLAAVMLRRQRVLRLAASSLALLCAFFLYQQVKADLSETRILQRNFYGTLYTIDIPDDELHDTTRALFHGSIKHGEQYLSAQRRREPTAYYGRSSGVGLAIEATRHPGQKVGVIGLGAGTLAAYGRTGDHYRMYEINPDVIALAQSEFTFMSDSPAQIETVLGDARLSMEKEAPQGYDVLAVDAFSGDSVPVHLLTVEAMGVYLRHTRPDGIIAFHVTNRFLNLPPVVASIAKAHGLQVAYIRDENDNPLLRNTDWVLVARDTQALSRAEIPGRSKPISLIPGLTPWTDDFNNLFAILK
ncbi:MAG TPA: fused MFS/spermidine synthase [Macromonas sp.]|nr:fused MFS/spermidine synthase [Macromonas sp.]